MAIKIEKLAVGAIAAALTNGVMANLPDTLTIDPDLKADDVRKANLMTWECYRVFYHAVVKSMEDDTNWPAPKMDASGVVGSFADAIGPIVQAGLTAAGLPQLGTIAAQLIPALVGKILPKGTPAPPPAPVPNPAGVALPGV